MTPYKEMLVWVGWLVGLVGPSLESKCILVLWLVLPNTTPSMEVATDLQLKRCYRKASLGATCEKGSLVKNSAF